MKPRTKRILNLALILGTLLIVLLIGLNDQDIGSAWDALKHLSLPTVLMCILCYLGFVAMDAASIHYFLRQQGYHISFGYMFYISIVGQFYSNITPGASGGQPMQIYYLYERGVPVGVATSALVIRFISFQAMLSVIGTVLWISHAQFVAANVGSRLWILIIGYTYNTLMVTALILLVLKRSAINWVLKWAIRLGTRFHLIKKPEETREKWQKSVDTFHDSISLIMHRPKQLIIQCLIGGAQLMFLMSIIWFVYGGLNLSGATYGQLVTLNVMEYLSAAYMPMPGASGAQEGVFSMYFSQVFPDGVRFAALLLWRFFTYYFCLLAGGIVVTAVGLRSGKSIREVVNIQETAEAENRTREQEDQKS